MDLPLLSESVKIFFSLAPARQDRNLFEKLRKHLSVLKRQGLIDVWYDSEISAGSNTEDSIQTYICTADIIVLLLSADFFDSDQCAGVEMPCALAQHATRSAHVIPVLLRPALWSGFSLEQYNPLPPDGRPVTTWSNRDMALVEVAKGIHRVVEELVRRWTGEPRAVQPPQFPLFTLTYRRNPFFTNRKATLDSLYHFFIRDQSGQTCIQALCGLAGVGKTLLAIEYAYRHQREYQAVLWLNAASGELLSQGLRSLADDLGIPLPKDARESARIAAINRWLKQHDRWLLVLDNLDDFSVLNQLIPSESGGHVLLTTTSPATGPFARAVPVEQMTPEEGALLLLKRAGIIPPDGSRADASETEYLQAVAIAQEFESYPLALDQAGAYIEETQRSLTSYLKLYRRRQAALLNIRGRFANEHPDPVTTTLALTFKKIASTNPDALELLRFLAFLYPGALPDEMIMHGASSLSGPLRTLASDPLALDDAIATLRRFSLVHHHADSTTLNMHHIVQVVARKGLTKQQQIRLAKQAVLLIDAVFPEVSFATWEACERYALQAQHCATLIHDFQLTLPEGALLLERLGFYYYQRGCYAQAGSVLSQALDLQERQRRTDPLDLTQTLNSLGLLSLRQARYQEAEAFHRRALALRERALGPDDPQTAESLHNLAVLYEVAGQYHQAEQFYLRVLSIDERAVGTDHPDIARTLNNLGLIYYLQGRYSQAETTYQRALTIYERISYTNHPDITYVQTGLGTLYEAQGRYQEAEALYQSALSIRKQALGENHSETAHSINKMARIHELRGDYQQAEALLQQARAIIEQELGAEHPDTALFLNNLALLAVRQGQYQQAEPLYQRALSIYERALGTEHPMLVRVLNNMGQLFREMGNSERAEALLQRALAIRPPVPGLTHPDTALTLSHLADLLVDQHASEEALTLLQQALAIYLQTLVPEHPEVTRVREKYATLLERMSRNDEAARLRQTGQTEAEPEGDH